MHGSEVSFMRKIFGIDSGDELCSEKSYFIS